MVQIQQQSIAILHNGALRPGQEQQYLKEDRCFYDGTLLSHSRAGLAQLNSQRKQIIQREAWLSIKGLISGQRNEISQIGLASNSEKVFRMLDQPQQNKFHRQYSSIYFAMAINSVSPMEGTFIYLEGKQMCCGLFYFKASFGFKSCSRKLRTA